MSDHHHHGHAHHHHAVSPEHIFLPGIILNTGFIAIEVLCGLWANSLALLADAGHNAGDVLALFLAWGAARLSQKTPSARFTYGLQSSSIMASLANAVLLLVTVGGIGFEAMRRLGSPEYTSGVAVMLVALAGVAVNGFTAWQLMKHQGNDLNIRSAYLHMVADAAISLGVFVAGGLVMATGWGWLDPLVSLAIALFIIRGAWDLLKSSTTLALHAVPEGIDPAEVRGYLASQAGVKEVHDLHIWAISTSETALSAHLLMPGGHPGDGILQKITAELAKKFSIHHATLQIELGDAKEACSLASDVVV
ncbi:MAG: cation transporter [Alphaproteobacteria bacterium]|nr:cation transporter [Alphaproteobacteria bacterium]